MQTENLDAEELHGENYSLTTAETSDQVLVSILYRLTGGFWGFFLRGINTIVMVIKAVFRSMF